MAIRKIYLGLMKIFLFMNGQNWGMEFSKSMDILEINNIRYFIMKNDLSMEELNMSWCQIFALIYPSKVGESKFTGGIFFPLSLQNHSKNPFSTLLKFGEAAV